MTDWAKRERDRAYDAKRRLSSPWRSWYRSARWKRKAKAHLKSHPHCRFCDITGVRTKATIVDHIERHQGDPFKFWNGKLQGLCKHHHDGIKQSWERGSKSEVDERGYPVDPSHPWAQS